MEDKPPRQRLNAARLKWLKGELPDLVAEGLVSQESAPKIVDKFEKQLAHGGKTWLVYVLGIFAAVLLGTGVIMFFASNWEYLSKFQKLTVICVALSGAYYGAYLLKYKYEYPIIGEAMILLGSLLLGAGIYLVAQAFNIKAHFPNGVLLWMLAIIPLMLLEKSKPLLAQATILFGIWVVWELIAIEGWRTPDEAYSNLTVRMIFALIPLAFLARQIYKMGAKANAALLVPAVATWLIIFLAAGMRHSSDNPGVMPLLPFAFFGAWGMLSITHSRDDGLPPFASIFRFFAMAGVGLFLYLLTFPKLVRELEVDEFNSRGLMVAAILVAFGGYAFYRAFAVESSGERKRFHELEATTWFCVIGYGVLATLFMTNRDAAPFVGILSNIAMVGFIAALVVVGTRAGRPGMVNYGVFLFAVLVITRYFDWFWDLFDRSLFFILGGLVFLLGGVFLEKRRRELVLKAKEASL